MAHLLDDEHRGVLVEHLIDRDHHAHLHEGLDDLVGLDGHALRELADGDRVADLDVADDGRRRLLEPVLRIDVDGHSATALLLLLAAAGHAVGNVQRVIALGRLFDHALFLGLLPRALRFGALLRLFLALRGLAALLFGALFRGLVGCGRTALLVFEALALLGFALLGREPLAFRGFALLALFANRAFHGGAWRLPRRGEPRRALPAVCAPAPRARRA